MARTTPGSTTTTAESEQRTDEPQPQPQPQTILTALVGSRAHGLAEPDSDYDYRDVFVTPTRALLQLGPRYGPTTTWNEGTGEDRVQWEVGNFLSLASKCNPTILEVLRSPQYTADDSWGEELRTLFPYLWNSVGVRAAFVGYGFSQRKKFLANKDRRQAKYATAYVRTLFNAWQLLTTGDFSVDVRGTEIEPVCRRYRAGDFTVGDVIETCMQWEILVNDALLTGSKHDADLRPVNDYLLRLRRALW